MLCSSSQIHTGKILCMVHQRIQRRITPPLDRHFHLHLFFPLCSSFVGKTRTQPLRNVKDFPRDEITLHSLHFLPCRFRVIGQLWSNLSSCNCSVNSYATFPVLFRCFEKQVRLHFRIIGNCVRETVRRLTYNVFS